MNPDAYNEVADAVRFVLLAPFLLLALWVALATADDIDRVLAWDDADTADSTDDDEIAANFDEEIRQ